MTRKTNNRNIAIGLIAGIAFVPLASWAQESQNALLILLAYLCMPTFFFCFWIYGVFARGVSFAMRHPIHNTQGYKPSFQAEPAKEKGGYMSQGYRRKWERRSFAVFRSLGIYVQDPEKETG